MQNIGNDASLEAIIVYARKELPDTQIDVMCFGAEAVELRFGIPATPLYWSPRFDIRPKVIGLPLKALGRIADVFRTAAWVRRHDCVIVPGTGVLESGLPLRPWHLPFTFFLTSAFGRLFGVKVVLVCVGATPVRQRWTRLLYREAARLADYRSFRDPGSREAARRYGAGTARDEVYTDLVFSLAVPAPGPVDKQLVCLGVMDYRGSNDDRSDAQAIRRAYLTEMTEFVVWLLDHNRRVRLVIGDANGSDSDAALEIMTAARSRRPDLDPALLEAPSITQFDDLLAAMQPASAVVAIRYHNVVAALMLGKPVLSLGYSSKQAALLEQAGLGEFGLTAKEISLDLLVARFTELEARSADISASLAVHQAAMADVIGKQFAALTELLSKLSALP